MSRKYKLQTGRTYTTHKGEKLHIISQRPNAINAEPLYKIKINGKYFGENPEMQVYKYIYGK